MSLHNAYPPLLPLTRRQFLMRGGAGFAGLMLGRCCPFLSAPRAASPQPAPATLQMAGQGAIYGGPALQMPNGMGGVAGLIQANVGLNMVFHNTQWVVALHAHTFLLTGVGMMLFGVVYALLPMLTELDIRNKRLVDVHFWCWIVGSVVMAYVMGMAGSQGMLRRMLYPHPNPYTPYTLIALAGGVLMAVGFLAFLANVVSTLGWPNVLSLVVPERWLKREAEAAA